MLYEKIFVILSLLQVLWSIARYGWMYSQVCVRRRWWKGNDVVLQLDLACAANAFLYTSIDQNKIRYK